MVEVLHAVSILPFNARGEVLLQQRDYTPGIIYPGHWTFFGGAVEPDDASYEAAAKRELFEEIELEMPLRHWYTYTCPDRSIPGERDVIVHVYIGETDCPVESLTLHEGMDFGYYDRQAARHLTIGFQKAPILEKFFDELERGRL